LLKVNRQKVNDGVVEFRSGERLPKDSVCYDPDGMTVKTIRLGRVSKRDAESIKVRVDALLVIRQNVQR
jgi:hypothetical protein